jgi:hypothetical protein
LKINSTNQETSFSLDLQEYYGFKSIFCNKGKGKEKGGVECSVGFCRRNFLPGIPSFERLDELNSFLEGECLNHMLKEKHYQTQRPLYEVFDEVSTKLEPFVRGKVWSKIEDELIVDNFQCICYRGYFYSVPLKYVGSKIKVAVSAFQLDLYFENNLVCSHKRLFLNIKHSLALDHYLDQLLSKPKAVRYAKVLKLHDFEEHLLEMRRRIYDRYSEIDSAKHFIQILLLKRTSSNEDFHTSILLALEYNAVSFSGVKSILLQLQMELSCPQKLDINHPNIDHFFQLDKYNFLEQKETEL